MVGSCGEAGYVPYTQMLVNEHACQREEVSWWLEEDLE